MSLESGNISYRMFYIQPRLPKTHLESFARNALPPIEILGTGDINGWVTGRHLLDRYICDESAYPAGYLRLALCKAERKIPPALLKAECKMMELAEMQARGVAFLKRKEKSDIKKEVTARLLPEMPPTLTGIDFVCERESNFLYATATSDKQVDAFTLYFKQTIGVSAIPINAYTIAAKDLKIDLRDLEPTSFSPEHPDETAEDHVGRDFLTWMWFFSEACGGVASLDSGETAVMIEGPLVFAYEGAGAHETVLRKGMPVVSAEAKTALTGGKKLKRAKVTFSNQGNSWSLHFDADDFTLRSVQLPQSDNVDPLSRFQERVLAIETLRQIIFEFYHRFLQERLNEKEWKAIRVEIHKWVSRRKARA